MLINHAAIEVCVVTDANLTQSIALAKLLPDAMAAAKGRRISNACVGQYEAWIGQRRAVVWAES
ncbi:MAG: hypothetical protein ACKVQQ_17265 [Burkholderiales bacterium]